MNRQYRCMAREDSRKSTEREGNGYMEGLGLCSALIPVGVQRSPHPLWARPCPGMPTLPSPQESCRELVWHTGNSTGFEISSVYFLESQVHSRVTGKSRPCQVSLFFTDEPVMPFVLFPKIREIQSEFYFCYQLTKTLS